MVSLHPCRQPTRAAQYGSEVRAHRDVPLGMRGNVLGPSNRGRRTAIARAAKIQGSLYGAGSSPVVDDGVVYVTSDREYKADRRSQVIAYDLKTGAERWRREPDFAHDSYATPLIYNDGRRKLLLALTSRTLAAYVAATGEPAWQLRTPIATPIPSLIADGDRLYIAGGLNGEGYTAAFRLRAGIAPEELWTSRRNPPDVASPVLFNGRLFTITGTGIMVCYDAASGEVIWRKRLGVGLGVFYASLVAADGKIYAARSSGTTHVVAAADEFRLLSESSLSEETFASPAVTSQCLFLRTDQALYCIGPTGDVMIPEESDDSVSSASP